jgi:hypothetical protein
LFKVSLSRSQEIPGPGGKPVSGDFPLEHEIEGDGNLLHSRVPGPCRGQDSGDVLARRDDRKNRLSAKPPKIERRKTVKLEGSLLEDTVFETG